MEGPPDAMPLCLDLPDGDAVFYPDIFPAADANRLLQELLATTAWRQESITLYGKSITVPRLTAWYGEEGTGYTYSGIVNHRCPGRRPCWR
jgi:alkylated DNA repair dioxygenase AlkB